MAVSVETWPSGTGRIPRRVIAQFHRIVAASHSSAEEFNEAHATRPPRRTCSDHHRFQSHTPDNSGPREREHPLIQRVLVTPISRLMYIHGPVHAHRIGIKKMPTVSRLCVYLCVERLVRLVESWILNNVRSNLDCRILGVWFSNIDL